MVDMGKSSLNRSSPLDSYETKVPGRRTNWLRVCWWCSPHSCKGWYIISYNIHRYPSKPSAYIIEDHIFPSFSHSFNLAAWPISSKSAESAPAPLRLTDSCPNINCATGVSPRSPSQDDPSGKAPSMRPHASSSLLSIRPHLWKKITSPSLEGSREASETGKKVTPTRNTWGESCESYLKPIQGKWILSSNHRLEQEHHLSGFCTWPCLPGGRQTIPHWKIWVQFWSSKIWKQHPTTCHLGTLQKYSTAQKFMV